MGVKSGAGCWPYFICWVVVLARRGAPMKKPKTKPRSKQPKKVKFISKYVCVWSYPNIIMNRKVLRELYVFVWCKFQVFGCVVS
jgi:hypothetical protein